MFTKNVTINFLFFNILKVLPVSAAGTTQKSSTSGGWPPEDDTTNDSRSSGSSNRNTPQISLQPPPAHQHQPLTRQQSIQSFNKPSMKNTPSSSSSSMTPMDLSAGYVKEKVKEL